LKGKKIKLRSHVTEFLSVDTPRQYSVGKKIGLFMHFCDSNYEITQMQQEEEQHQRTGINCMLMRI